MKRELLPLAVVFITFTSIMAGGWYLWGLVVPEFGRATGGLYILFAFLAGIASFFAPCAFALLPGYASYYLGIDEGKVRAPAYSGLVTATGILAFYLVLGILVYAFGSVVSPYLRYFKPSVGFVFLLLGMALYSGYSLPFPRVAWLPQDRGAITFFIFGIAYAATALGCTLPIFLALVIYPLFTGKLLLGLAAFMSYSLAKAALMVAVTCLVAYSKDALIKGLAMSTAKIKKFSGLVIMLIGTYLIYSGGLI